MNTIKRTLAILMALVVTAALFPAAAWELFAVKPKAADLTITTVSEWNAFTRAVTAADNFTGKTVELGADIVFTEATIAGVAHIFSGTFNGNGYRFIITKDSASFSTSSASTSGARYYSGLFASLSGATINEVVVEFGPSVLSFYASSGMVGPSYGYNSRKNVTRAGVIAGEVTNSVIDRCAVIQSNGSTTFCNVSTDTDDDMRTGAIAAYLTGASSRIINCYADINIAAYLTNDTDYCYLGGIVGDMRDGSQVLSSIYRGNNLHMHHTNPTKDGGKYAAVGGIVGQIYNGCDVSNSIVYAPNIYIYDIIESEAKKGNYERQKDTNTYAGLAGPVAGKPFGDLSSNYATVYLQGAIVSKKFHNEKGAGSTLSALTGYATTLGTLRLNHEWLVKPYYPVSKEIALNAEGDLTLTVTPSPVDIRSATAEVANKFPASSDWRVISLSVPQMGKRPTPLGIETMDAEPQVSAVTVKPRAATLSSGKKNAFTVEIKGTGIQPRDFVMGENVVFSYKYSGTTTPIPAGDIDGNLLYIPDDLDKDIIVTATVTFNDVETTGEYRIMADDVKDTRAVAITTTAGTTALAKGGVYAVDATFTGSAAFTGQTFTWDSIGFGLPTIASGVFTIPAAASATEFNIVPRVGSSNLNYPQKFTIGAMKQETLAATDAGASKALTLTAGSTIKLSVTGTTNDDTTKTEWSGGTATGSGVIEIEYPVHASGTVAVKATDGTKTATFNIAATAAPTVKVTPVVIPNDTKVAADLSIVSEDAATAFKIIPNSSSSNPSDYQYAFTTAAPTTDEEWVPWDGNPVNIPNTVTTTFYIRMNGDGTANTYYPSDAMECTYTDGSWVAGTGDVGNVSSRYNATLNDVLMSGGVFNIDKYLRDNSVVRSNGEVIVTFRLNYSPYGEYSVLEFATSHSASFTGGTGTEAPVISPGANEIIDTNVGIQITAAAGAEIYYTLTPDTKHTPKRVTFATPSISDLYDETTNPNGRTYKYISGESIAFPTGETSFTVAAIAKEPDKAVSSVARVDYQYSENLEKPVSPSLLMGDSKLTYALGTLYDPGEALHFSHPSYNPGQPGESYIRYSLTETDPSATYGVTYDPANPPRLPDNVAVQVVKAMFYDGATGLESKILTERVQVRQKMPGPVAYTVEGGDSNDEVRLNQSIYLTLHENALQHLTGGEYSFVTAEANQADRDKYAYGSADADKVTVVGEPQTGIRYLSFAAYGDEAGVFPQIQYSTTNELATRPITYHYATRIVQEVYSEDDGSLQSVTITYTNPMAIAVTGTPGESFVVNAKVISTSTTNDSIETALLFRIKQAVANPSAYPMTSNDSPTQLQVGDRIHLSSDNDALIYYTMDGFEPRVTYFASRADHLSAVGDDESKVLPTSSYPCWVPQNDSTLLFDAVSGITITTDDRVLLTINAIAVHPTNTMESSPVISIRYGIKPLTASAEPRSRPETSQSNPTGLVNGTPIYLSSSTTNSRIYYTLNGVNPDISGYLAYEKALAEYQQNPVGNAPQPPDGTYLYDPKVGIPMMATREQPEFEITAIAAENSDPPKYGHSVPVIFTFQLKKVETPVSTPATSSSSVPTVSPGSTIQLATTTQNATIYWTRGGTTPAIIPSNRYDSNVGITMPQDITTFFTISAVAVADGYANSDPVIMSFQPPAPVQAVLASPPGGQVTSGTKVSLTTTTSDAIIYYTTDGSEPVPYESSVYNEKNPPTVDKKMTLSAIAVANGVTSALAEYNFEIAKQLSAPTASLPTGSVVYKGTRIRLSGTGTIAYTIDGNDPKAILESDSTDKEDESKVFYGNSVVIDVDYGESLTVRAYAYKSGNTPSETAAFTYTVCEKEEYLSASPESETVIKPGTTVSLSTSITDAKIFYSFGDTLPVVRNVYSDGGTDAYDPLWEINYASGNISSSSSGYYEWTAGTDTYEGSNVVINGEPGTTVTVRAIAVSDGSDGGVAKVFHYHINDKSQAPSATIPSGAITLDGARVGLLGKGTIYYTTNGESPTTDSMVYSEVIRVNRSMSVRAMAVEGALEPSGIVTFNYTRAGDTPPPEFSIETGEYALQTEVRLTHPYEGDMGLTIYYTTNGSDPTVENGTVYNQNVPLKLMRPVTIKAMAVFTGYHNSGVITNNYTVIEPTKEDPSAEPDSSRTPPPTDRLVSRRDYDKFSGPTLSDVVLYTGDYKALAGGMGDALNKGASLFIREEVASNTILQSLRNDSVIYVCELYMELGGTRVQPAGPIEIGLEIPENHRNGIVSVVRLYDDGTQNTDISVRRADNRCYFTVSDLDGKFIITAPKSPEDSRNMTGLIAGLIAAGITGTIAAILILVGRRRRGRAKN